MPARSSCSGRRPCWSPPYFVTGVGLWEPGLAYFERLLGFKATIDQLRLAALIHATAAVLAITIWIIHVYAAIWVRGTISAMTRGTVTGGWGWRHHRKWLRKGVDKGEIERERLTAACSAHAFFTCTSLAFLPSLPLLDTSALCD
jgi:hypothetical protein